MNPANSSVINTAGRNALVTSLMVCCGYVVCWTPVEFMFFLGYVGYPVDFTSWYYHFAVVLAFTNSCVNPFIYTAKYSEFKQAVGRLKSNVSQQPSQVAAIG